MIVFCTTSSQYGGVARVQQHIREYLHDSGLKYIELSYNPKSLRLLNQVRFIRKLRQVIKGADYLIFSHPHLFRAMDFIPSKTFSTIVFTHGLELYKAGPESVSNLLKDVNLVVTNSKFNENWLKSKANLSNVQSVYYPGLKFSLNSNPKGNQVLCVSRMMKTEEYKGHRKLIEAWEQVAKEIPDSSLLFCGKGDLVQDLKDLVSNLNLDESITFTGYVSDLELIDLYQQSSVFAMPSLGEGQGLVWLEAMQAGLPIIAASDTVAEEFVTDGEHGILVSKNFTKEELASAIIKALNDKNWRNKVRKANSERVKDLSIADNFNSFMDESLNVEGVA